MLTYEQQINYTHLIRDIRWNNEVDFATGRITRHQYYRRLAQYLRVLEAYGDGMGWFPNVVKPSRKRRK
jgi:hypothetical protein